MPATAETLVETSPKRRAILDAAAGLFMAEGYGAVSMDAVARAAQVSKATLYAHFTGKEALFAEIIDGNCARLKGSVAVALSGHATPLRAALVEIGTQWLRFLLQPRVRALHRVVIGEGGRFPDLARSFYANGPVALRLWLADWLAEEAARGRLRPGTDAELAAEQFLSLLRGDLFLRATLGLLEEVREAEIVALASAAACAIDRLYGVSSESGQEGFARTP
jgi:TetR/AcrR family transcriptional repressor of mexJK operon